MLMDVHNEKIVHFAFYGFGKSIIETVVLVHVNNAFQ